jgi:hypothetical protein
VRKAGAAADPERREQIEGALDRSLQKDVLAAILQALDRAYPVEQYPAAVDEVLNRY